MPSKTVPSSHLTHAVPRPLLELFAVAGIKNNFSGEKADFILALPTTSRIFYAIY